MKKILICLVALQAPISAKVYLSQNDGTSALAQKQKAYFEKNVRQKTSLADRGEYEKLYSSLYGTIQQLKNCQTCDDLSCLMLVGELYYSTRQIYDFLNEKDLLISELKNKLFGDYQLQLAIQKTVYKEWFGIGRFTTAGRDSR